MITKPSPLDRLFEGLPVVAVQDWEEVGAKGRLSKWLRQYGRLTDREHVWNRLDPDRLIRTIRETLAVS